MVTAVAVVALAVVALALVVFALRTPEVRNEGEAPPQILDSATATPTPTPTPTVIQAPTAAPNDPQLLQIGTNGRGIRASEGDCLSSPGLVETTSDGGLTWAPVSFGDVPVRQILSVEIVDTSQIDVVAKTGASCAVSMVSSFTDGAFWQEYPDRVAEALYVDPIDPGTIHDRGTVMVAPCAVDQVVGTPSAPAILCDGQIQAFDPATATWSVIVPAGVTSFGFDASGGLLTFTRQDASDCTGTRISWIGTTAGSSETPVSCLESAAPPRFVTVARDGATVWYWSDSGFQLSVDSGLTWAVGN